MSEEEQLKNTVKKELYKQRPLADYVDTIDNVMVYTTKVTVNQEERQVEFHIPKAEEQDFFNEPVPVPAQLLIRWLACV